ncbi:ATP-binding protein [Piscinibacter sakaiensis]|uniref:ATP-binding protein n=1 Tax=Piscinibacter sakaiensis TaxID=1547922 RepID=UPI003AAB5C56
MNAGESACEIRFDRCRLRLGERMLLIDDEPAKLGARAFDLLVALIERRDRTVGKNELLELVWPGLVVEENNLQVQVSALRKLLGPQAIATIPGRGYRFTANVEGCAQPDRAPSRAEPAARRIGNLPEGLPTLFGRDDDIGALVELVQAHRLVSVVGAGGIGKTRLAQAAAHRLGDRFADGVWWVELARIVDPAQLADAVAQTLGAALPNRKAALDEIVDAVRNRALLLVLDNCEHLVDAASALAASLLEHAPQVRLLVTSQELLRVGGEYLFRATPLALPGDNSLESAQRAGAVALFVERVAALQPGFRLDAGNVDDVREICRRLDGLPLAIEMAAARVPLLGVAGVRERLHQRLHLLTGGSRAALPRHQTLRETLAWSHGLLGDDEQTVFRRIGVFVGGFALPAARRVLASDTADDEWQLLEHLGTLVDKSLLVVDEGEPPRYRLLETARVFALERLRDAGETGDMLRRHAQAMQQLFELEFEQFWLVPSQLRARRTMPDIDNLRAALDWARDAGEHELQLALTGSSAWIWWTSSLRVEGLRRCDEALALVSAAMPPLWHARLLRERAVGAHPRYGDAERQAIARAVELCRTIDDRRQLYASLAVLARVNAMSLDIDGAEAALRKMENLEDDGWPLALRAERLFSQTWVPFCAGRPEQCEEPLRQFERIAEQADDQFMRLTALMGREQMDAVLGRTEEAVALGQQLLELTRLDPFSRFRLVAVNNLGTSLAALGRTDEAVPLLREAAALNARRGTLFTCLDPLALLALRQGRPADAARVLGHADFVFASFDGRREGGEAAVRRRVAAELRRLFDPAALRALFTEGAALSDDEILRIAFRGDAG